MYGCFSLPKDEPVVSRAAPGDSSHRARRNAGDRRKAARSIALYQGALKRVAGKRFDVALLDFAILDARAIATVKQLHGRITLLPIVVVSDHDEDELTIEVMRAGADDHLKHGNLSAKVLARTLTFAVARNVRMRKKAAAPAHSDVQATAGVILDRCFSLPNDEPVMSRAAPRD